MGLEVEEVLEDWRWRRCWGIGGGGGAGGLEVEEVLEDGRWWRRC